MNNLVNYLQSKTETFFEDKTLTKKDLFMRLTILINFLNRNKNFKFCFISNDAYKNKLGKGKGKNLLPHDIYDKNSIRTINNFLNQILQSIILTENIEDINSELNHIFFLQCNRVIYQNIYKDILFNIDKHNNNFNTVDKIKDYLKNIIKKLERVKELQDHDLGYNYFFNDLDNYNEFIFLILKSLKDDNLDPEKFIIILFSKHILPKILPDDFDYTKTNIKKFITKLKDYLNSLKSLKKKEKFEKDFEKKPILTLMNLIIILLNSDNTKGMTTTTSTHQQSNLSLGPNNSNFPIRLGLLDEFKIPWDKLANDDTLYQETLHNISELLNNSKYLSIIKDIAENITDNN